MQFLYAVVAVLLVLAAPQAWAVCKVPGTSTTCPNSTVITGINFDFTVVDTDASGDNFPVTWHENGHQYTSWGDGAGFSGSGDGWSIGISRVTGGPPASASTKVDQWGGTSPTIAACVPDSVVAGETAQWDDPNNPSNCLGAKSYGMLAIDNRVYFWIGPMSGNNAYTADGLNLGDFYAKSYLVYVNTDTNAFSGTDVKFNSEQSGAVFSHTFLQMGQDYAANSDGYVYAYAPYLDTRAVNDVEVQRQSGNGKGRIALMRVLKANIATLASWEYWVGPGNTWTSTFANKQPVFEDDQGVGWSMSATYNPGLGRYMLITEHCDTANCTGTNSEGRIGIFESANPYGPWARVLYMDADGFGNPDTSTFFWNFAPKWWSANGKEGTLVYTGIGAWDVWNTVRVTLNTPAGIEAKCLGLGSECVCSEPFNGNTYRPAGGVPGNTNWAAIIEGTNPRYDPDDSPAATGCGMEVAGGGDFGYCNGGLSVVSAGSHAAFLPAGNTLSHILMKTGKSICGFGFKPTSYPTDTTTCMRHYLRWDNASYRPEPDPSEPQQKMMTYGGTSPDGQACKLGQWSVKTDQNTAVTFLNLATQDCNYYGPAGNSQAIYDMEDCVNNFCRVETCLDFSTAGIIRARGRLTPIANASGVGAQPSHLTTPTFSTIPRATLSLVSSDGDGISFFGQNLNGVGTFLRYATHFIITAKSPADTGPAASSFWPGPATEVEGGGGAGTPTWGAVSGMHSPRTSCEEDAAECDNISLTGSAAGTLAAGAITWTFDCDTAQAPAAAAATACNTAGLPTCNTGGICDYISYPAGSNITAQLCSTRENGATDPSGCIPMTFSVVAAPTEPGEGNVALAATPTVSSKQNESQPTWHSAANLIDTFWGPTSADSVVDCWTSNGQANGAWAQLDWSTPVLVDRVVLTDLPFVSPNWNVVAGTLLFSDGSTVAVGQLPNDGQTGLTVNFSARSVTSVRFTATTVSGTAGLCEFEVYSAVGQPSEWALTQASLPPGSCNVGNPTCDDIDMLAQAVGDATGTSSWEYDCDLSNGYSVSAADNCEGTGDTPSADEDGDPSLCTQNCTIDSNCDYSAKSAGVVTAEIRTTKDGIQSILQPTFVINPAPPDPGWGCNTLTLTHASCTYADPNCAAVGYTLDENGDATGAITRSLSCYPSAAPVSIPSDTGCTSGAADCVIGTGNASACNMSGLATGVYAIQVTTDRATLSETCTANFTVIPRPAQIQGAGAR